MLIKNYEFYKDLFWSLFFLPDTLKERSKVQSLRKAKDKDIHDRIMVSTNIFNIYKLFFRTEKNLSCSNEVIDL